MNSITKIKNRIASLLQKEIDRSNAEIQELRQKQQDNIASYGIGGPYRRYDQAIERRQNHLTELEAIRKAQGCAVILETLRMYGYFCPTCSEKIYLTGRSPDTVECPICIRRIYRDGLYTEWNVQKKKTIYLHTSLKQLGKEQSYVNKQNGKSNVATVNELM